MKIANIMKIIKIKVESLEETMSNQDEQIMKKTSDLEAALETFQTKVENEIAQNSRNNVWMEESVRDLSGRVRNHLFELFELTNENSRMCEIILEFVL